GKQVLHIKMTKGASAGGPMGGSPFVGGSAGKLVGKGTVLGRPCEIRMMGTKNPGHEVKVWVWNGLPLRSEIPLPQGGKMTTEATQVETAPKLSAALFKLPAGYTVKEFQMPAGAPGAPPKWSCRCPPNRNPNRSAFDFHYEYCYEQVHSQVVA